MMYYTPKIKSDGHKNVEHQNSLRTFCPRQNNLYVDSQINTGRKPSQHDLLPMADAS